MTTYKLHIFRLATEYWNRDLADDFRNSSRLHIFRLATEYWNYILIQDTKHKEELHIFRLATEYWNLNPKSSLLIYRGATYLSTRYRVLKPQYTTQDNQKVIGYISFDSLQSTETAMYSVCALTYSCYISFDSLQSTETRHDLKAESPFLELHIFRLATEYWNIFSSADWASYNSSYISFDSLQSTETLPKSKPEPPQVRYISFDSLQSTETRSRRTETRMGRATYLSTRYRVLKPRYRSALRGSGLATYLSTRYRVLKRAAPRAHWRWNCCYISFDSLQSTETWGDQ